MLGKTVLVADDDKAILEVIKIILSDAGFNVVTVDGKDVKQTLHSQAADLILLDIWMAGLNGKEVLSSLKKDPKTKNIPVLIISANADIKKLAIDIGADGYIEKPFDIKDLVKQVRKYTK